MKSNSRDPNKSAGILHSSKCRCCISSSRPLFLVPCSVFFPFHAGHQICSFCVTTFPTLKKVCPVTVLRNHKANLLPICQHGFISACSTVADKPTTHWSFSRDCAASSFLKPPKSATKFQRRLFRELKSRPGSCIYNLHHAVCFFRTSYQLMLKTRLLPAKPWTLFTELSALVKCGHETKQALCADPSIQHLHQ